MLSDSHECAEASEKACFYYGKKIGLVPNETSKIANATHCKMIKDGLIMQKHLAAHCWARRTPWLTLRASIWA
jgi:hypothetical protein